MIILLLFLLIILFFFNLNFNKTGNVISNNQDFFVQNKIISNCMDIDNPGNYILVKNISSDKVICLNISSNNVFINCNGHEIIGNKKGHFIYLNQENFFKKVNITLKDCIIKNWIDESDFIPLNIEYPFENKTKEIMCGKDFNFNLNVTCIENCNNLSLELVSNEKIISSYNISIEKGETENFNLKGKARNQSNESFFLLVYSISQNNKKITFINKREEILFKPTLSLQYISDINQTNQEDFKDSLIYSKLISMMKVILWFLFVLVILLSTLIVILFSFKKIRKKLSR